MPFWPSHPAILEMFKAPKKNKKGAPVSDPQSLLERNGAVQLF